MACIEFTSELFDFVLFGTVCTYGCQIVVEIVARTNSNESPIGYCIGSFVSIKIISDFRKCTCDSCESARLIWQMAPEINWSWPHTCTIVSSTSRFGMCPATNYTQLKRLKWNEVRDLWAELCEIYRSANRKLVLSVAGIIIRFAWFVRSGIVMCARPQFSFSEATFFTTCLVSSAHNIYSLNGWLMCPIACNALPEPLLKLTKISLAQPLECIDNSYN